MEAPKPRTRMGGFVLLLDILAVCILFYCIPYMPRPLEVIMGAVAILCFATVALVKSERIRSVALVVMSVAFAVFGIELAEKFFSFTERLEHSRADVSRHDFVKRAGYVRDEENPYFWDRRFPGEYLAARERAIADGMDPEAFVDDFAGDVFKGIPNVFSQRKSRPDHDSGSQSLKPRNVTHPQLGFVFAPDNRVRAWCREKSTGTMMYDGVATITPEGIRETKGGKTAESQYVFLGCSFTYGSGLSDWQTLPYYFSEATGFSRRVVNLGVGGYGPHQVLRNLELDFTTSAAGLSKGRVKAVVYSLIDDHVRRVARPEFANVPVYALDGEGKLVYQGVKLRDGFFRSRLWRLYERGRVLPNVVPRLRSVNVDDPAGYENSLFFATMEKLDQVCRERYGIGLTIVYWDNSQTMIQGLASKGLEVIRVDEAFGYDWRGPPAIKYLLYDGHPSAYGNRVLGHYLAARLVPEHESER